MLNPLVARAISSLHNESCPPADTTPVSHQPLSVGDLEPVRRLRRYVNDAIGWLGVNRAVESHDKKRGMPAGRIRLPFNLSLPTLADSKLGLVNMRIDEIELGGMDTFFALDVLQPDAREPTLLHQTVGLGSPSAAYLSFGLDLQLHGEWHRFEVNASAAGVLANVGVVVDVDGSMSAHTFLDAVGHSPACAILPLRNMSLSRDGSTSLVLNGTVELRVSSSPDRGPAVLVRRPLELGWWLMQWGGDWAGELSGGVE